MNKDQSQSAEVAQADQASPGYFKRYRLPLFLAVVAICLYAGSILYMMYGRGQIA
ncbi:hypothetical protein N9850_01760 [Granulosicoccus sp.]|nr:hypothetical protein [Granulosicoccus sp.]MDB4222468.1 hypothetical protein [Granulosicoccus sp.]